MHELMAELKQLRLHGMAQAWADLIEQGGEGGLGPGSALDASRWLVAHLVQAESVDRATRSVSHQMNAAKFPVHRDLAGFDFEASPVDRKQIGQLADAAFTEAAHNAVLMGGPGTGAARGAHPAPLAGKGDQIVVRAIITPHPRKPVIKSLSVNSRMSFRAVDCTASGRRHANK